MRPSHRLSACAAIVAVLGTGLGVARAEEQPPPLTPPPAATPPPPAPEAPPPAPPAPLTRLQRPIPSPLHSRMRMMPGATLGTGIYCPNYGSPSMPYGRWCTPQVYLALDGPFMNMHVSLLFGDVLRYGALFGFDLGTQYMQLGGKRSRVAIALRGSFDLLIAGLGEPIPGHRDDGLLGFSNTYGPHLSIALNPKSAFEIRGAVGYLVGGFFDRGQGFDRADTQFLVESWIGLRVSP